MFFKWTCWVCHHRSCVVAHGLHLCTSQHLSSKVSSQLKFVFLKINQLWLIKDYGLALRVPPYESGPAQGFYQLWVSVKHLETVLIVTCFCGLCHLRHTWRALWWFIYVVGDIFVSVNHIFIDNNSIFCFTLCFQICQNWVRRLDDC